MKHLSLPDISYYPKDDMLDVSLTAIKSDTSEHHNPVKAPFLIIIINLSQEYSS